jgi:hypothetical protein
MRAVILHECTFSSVSIIGGGRRLKAGSGRGGVAAGLGLGRLKRRASMGVQHWTSELRLFPAEEKLSLVPMVPTERMSDWRLPLGDVVQVSAE